MSFFQSQTENLLKELADCTFWYLTYYTGEVIASIIKRKGEDKNTQPTFYVRSKTYQILWLPRAILQFFNLQFFHRL